jgi:hypothetical protein
MITEDEFTVLVAAQIGTLWRWIARRDPARLSAGWDRRGRVQVTAGQS